MTFNPAVPANNQSPAVFPQQNRDNMLRLQTIVEQDHQYNTTAATNDGWHKIVHWVQQSGQIDPLNPGATAPSNVGGPPITWEQEDVYGVPRAWLREANGFLVHSMIGETEIRVNGFLVTQAIQDLFTPPDDSYGHIFYKTVALGTGMATYWKTGGTLVARTYSLYNGRVGPNLGLVTFPTELVPSPALKVQLGSASDPNQTVDFRILYRYL